MSPVGNFDTNFNTAVDRHDPLNVQESNYLSVRYARGDRPVCQACVFPDQHLPKTRRSPYPNGLRIAGKRSQKWKNKTRVCTRALYSHIDQEFLKVKNLELPDKLRYPTKKSRHRPNIKHLGDSIDNRPAEVQMRQAFGHWEIDTAISKKNREDDVLLPLIERKTRYSPSQNIEGKDPDSVGYDINQLIHLFGSSFSHVFQTITANNDSEFRVWRTA